MITFVADFPDPVKATIRRLGDWCHSKAMALSVDNKLGLHRQLASSDITQYGVI